MSVDWFEASVGTPGVWLQCMMSIAVVVGFWGIWGGEESVVGVAPRYPSGVSGPVEGGPVLGWTVPV